MTDSRQSDGDEPVNEVQKSHLRSLVGVLGHLAADRPDLQYPVKNLMREVTHATCGTLARARPVVKYLVHEQLEQQRAAPKCSNSKQGSVATFHCVCKAAQPQLAA